MKNRFAVLAVVVLSLAWMNQLSAQKSSRQQCALAVFSHQVSNKQLVCSSKVVQQMALRGHAFEQNQMGMASMLVIGPEYSEAEALKWFEQAAQRGYAPAQVNLAVMYVNGWGTPGEAHSTRNWLTG